MDPSVTMESERRRIGEVLRSIQLIASVIIASTPDPSVFRSGRDFAAWLGLTPRQNQMPCSKERLGKKGRGLNA
jgi:transposase